MRFLGNKEINRRGLHCRSSSDDAELIIALTVGFVSLFLGECVLCSDQLKDSFVAIIVATASRRNLGNTVRVITDH